MTTIFNTDNLYWVYTKHAKERLAEFDITRNLKLYKIKIGDYDWYTDEDKKLGEGGYSEASFKAYFQDYDKTDLGHVILGENEDGDNNVPLEFMITGKEIGADGESVIFTATVDEECGGFDIREIGIYEVVESDAGVYDELFAVCTMQPIPKPTTETNHYIATQINCHLFSPKLVSFFDNIEIEKTNNYTTKAEMRDFLTNLLFVESNLAEQISRNSQLIGYNRVQQLYELMRANQNTYSKFGLSTIYATLANIIDVKNFWIFDYSGNLNRTAMLRDLSLNNQELGTDQLSTRYERDFSGLAAWLNFNNAHYFVAETPTSIKRNVLEDGTVEYYAPNDDDLTFIDLHKDEDGKIISVSDSPFTIIFVGAQNNNSDTNTILCKYNTFAEHPGLSVVVTPKREVVVSLYSTRNGYVTFTTPEGSVPVAGNFYALIIEYNGDSANPQITVNIDGHRIIPAFENVGNVYRGMSLEGILLPMFSFERTASGDKKHINSKVCLLSLIKGTLSDKNKQALMYNLMSLIGNDPCLV